MASKKEARQPITPEKLLVDREQAFLLYATFCGDIEKTAHSLNISASAVSAMATANNWPQKLQPILDLKKSARPGDIERAINRALNFVQAHRYRLFLERALQRLHSFTDAELTSYMESRFKTKDGQEVVKLSTRSLADFATALEKAHALTYIALHDTAPERIKRQAREEQNEEPAVVDIHAKISEAMNKVAASQSPKALLFDAQVKQGEFLAEQAKRVTNYGATPSPGTMPEIAGNPST